MQAVEERDQIVALPWVAFSWSHLESSAICDAGGGRGSSCFFDGRCVIVKSQEAAVWECLCHQNRGCPMPTAHVCDPSASFEFVLYTFKCGNPFAEKMTHVARSEKAFGPAKEARVVFVPSYPFTCPKSFKNLRLVFHHRDG